MNEMKTTIAYNAENRLYLPKFCLYRFLKYGCGRKRRSPPLQAGGFPVSVRGRDDFKWHKTICFRMVGVLKWIDLFFVANTIDARRHK